MANQGFLKRLNRARLLDAIRREDSLHRAAVADHLGLDRKSVTNLASELLDSGWLVETGLRRPRRGRPLIVLGLNRSDHYHLGLHLSETQVVGVLVNLYGEIVYRVDASYAFGSSLREISAALSHVFSLISSHAGSRLRGIGLAVPGILDWSSGRMVRSVNLPSLDGVLLRQLFSDCLSAPVILEEASRAKTQAEKWFGLGREAASFVCVDLGIGIGAGIVTERHLHNGTNPGEIGHNIISPGGNLCRCGHHGCLEAYISERVICEQISQTQKRQVNSLNDVQPDDESIQEILGRAGFALGLGLAPLINILCPPLIVLSGNLARFAAGVFPEMERGLAEAALPWSRQAVTVKASTFATDEAAALGAAAAAMSDIFEVTNIDEN